MSSIKVLYVCHTPDSKGGATYSLLNMIESVKGKVDPIVLFPSKGCGYELFAQAGIRCVVHPFMDNIFIPRKGTSNFLRYVYKVCKKAFHDRTTVKNILKKLDGERIDIVHSNSSVITIGQKIAKMLRCKHVWHLREYQDLDLDLCVDGDG